jgi:hypothetical protein
LKAAFSSTFKRTKHNTGQLMSGIKRWFKKRKRSILIKLTINVTKMKNMILQEGMKDT